MCSTHRSMMPGGCGRWRTGRLGAVLFAILIQVVNGYEDIYTISQLSPKSVSLNEKIIEGVVLETSQTENIDIRLEPSAINDEGESESNEVEKDNHVIIARSADPVDRESRSINVDNVPITDNNEIDSEIEIHKKRKYYDILPTKTLEYIQDGDDQIVMSSEGFGDRLDFRFPGEVNRVPKALAVSPLGPQIRPTAVQTTFATMNYRDQGRQNTEIQNIITGIVKLLNGNVNVHANSQLLKPGRPMASRINNRGPPKISEVPPLPDFADKPITPPVHYHPTKTPPPYPFDRPPPEQIGPPLRPGFHRPLPPWYRPRPRPPSRRPNPHLPMYKPFPTLPEEKPEEVTVTENETAHSENNLHVDEKDTLNLAEVNIVNFPGVNITQTEDDIKVTTLSNPTSPPSTTSTNSTIPLTSEEPEKTTIPTTTSTTEKSTENPTSTEIITTEDTITEISKPTTEKLTKPEKEKKNPEKDYEKDKPSNKDKYKVVDDNLTNNTSSQNETSSSNERVIESSMVDSSLIGIAAATPTVGLSSQLVSVGEQSTANSTIKSSPVVQNESQPTTPPPQGIPYRPYRRPGIVLDDPDFKPHAHGRPRPEPPLITAMPQPHPHPYGEIFDVTVSAIQGPGGESTATPHFGHAQPVLDNDDIIVSAVGTQGFVSIDGKRTYLNLFDSSTAHAHVASVRPTRVQDVQPSVPPLNAPPLNGVGSGVAVLDDPPHQTHQSHQPPHIPHASRPHAPSSARPQQPYRRPQPTVRIDTCIVGDDSTCDQAQHEKCRTEAGISSCQCRAGYARRNHRDPCRRVVALQLSLRVDRLYDRRVAWDAKLEDRESEPYQQLSYEALRAVDSAFSMTPFSDDFVSGTVNSVQKGEGDSRAVYINCTVLIQESPESLRTSVAVDIQKHLLGVIRRRSNNVGASALWVDTPAGSVLPLQDLDECASPELNDCDPLATCINTWGAFRCSCPDYTRDTNAGTSLTGRRCETCASSHCNERGTCRYNNNQPYCSCNSGYYGSTCEVDGEVVGVAVGASLAAALVIAATLAALLAWSRKWSREQKALGMGSPVFSYMAANTIKSAPVPVQSPYQVSLEERIRWAQIAEAMAQNNHYATETSQGLATRPSSAMFGGYPTLPPVPMPRMTLHRHDHTGTLASRANTAAAASHHNIYGYTNHMASESTSSEASSHVQERADLLVPRPKSRARSMHNQNNIYYDVEYENAGEGIYGTKGIPLSTYTVSRGREPTYLTYRP